MILAFLLGGAVFVMLDNLAGPTAVAALAALCVFGIVAQVQREQHMRAVVRETVRYRWAARR